MKALDFKIVVNVKSAQDVLVIQVCNKMICFCCCCLLVRGKGSVIVTLLKGATGVWKHYIKYLHDSNVVYSDAAV